MSFFQSRSRESMLDLRKYMRETCLPPLLQKDGSMPCTYEAEGMGSLSVRPEPTRRLECMYNSNNAIFEKLGSWLEQTIPAKPIFTKEPDPATGECLTIPNQASRGYSLNLEKHPEDLHCFLPWLDRLPLITAQRIIHLLMPETRDWRLRSTLVPVEQDTNIWFEYVWAKKTKIVNLTPEPIDGRSITIGVQPPWILTENLMKQFIGCKSFPPYYRPGYSYPDHLTTKDRLWAKLWDACVRHRTRYFVLTSYENWVFGVFSPGWTTAFTTNIQKASQTGPTVLELLCFWIASSMHAPGGFSLPLIPEPFFKEHIGVPVRRRRGECPCPADLEGEWDTSDRDSIVSDRDLPTEGSEMCRDEVRSIYMSKKKGVYTEIETWRQTADDSGAYFENLSHHEEPQVDTTALPFVVEMVHKGRKDNEYAGQWLAVFPPKLNTVMT
ncbi:hypothetical protein FA15DRAFT_608813 [Coprinopsis marcescibilis]|uniref:Uncharacterized protein n=1 Tax=Coprinopsis marcescibilis TaxID=230819 RepID=A0A5C3LB50_COPMA|nr:hypothetical protein FA15DRAFT_608813 [Coprinopsis marcescibilis]